MIHRHPHRVHRDHDEDQPLMVRVSRAVTDALGTWQFIAAFHLITTVWMVWGVWFRGPDAFPFQLLTMLLSLLAIDMTALVLLASNYQDRVDRVLRANAYQQTREVLELEQRQLGILHNQDAGLAKLDDIVTALHDLRKDRP